MIMTAIHLLTAYCAQGARTQSMALQAAQVANFANQDNMTTTPSHQQSVSLAQLDLCSRAKGRQNVLRVLLECTRLPEVKRNVAAVAREDSVQLLEVSQV